VNHCLRFFFIVLLLLGLLLCIVSLSWYMFSLLVVLAKPSVLVEKDCSVCVRVVMSSRLECCWNKVFDTTWQ